MEAPFQTVVSLTVKSEKTIIDDDDNSNTSNV